MHEAVKPLRWTPSTREDLRKFPRDVRIKVGTALWLAQNGRTATYAKPFKVGKGSCTGVMEIVAEYDTDTYRAVYTVRFRDAIYVLHCFEKKSKSGARTSKRDVDLIYARLKWAEADHTARQKEGRG